jgi:two-component system, chemotaxis family, chemotaxis protein CheY
MQAFILMAEENEKVAAGNQFPGTLLLVEDDEDIRQALTFAIEAEGYRVVSAEDGISALSLLSSLQVPPRLILLDIMMPKMDGWQFLRERRKHPNLSQIPVYVMSALQERRLLEPATGYLHKPVELDDLIALLHRHADQNLGAAS